MRIKEKVDLISQIGRKLQSLYSYDEIDAFLGEFGISPPKDGVGSNSKWIYSKAALRGHDDAVILRVAAELDMIPSEAAPSLTPPQNWNGTTRFRLFISHLSRDKDKATRLKECLSGYGIDAFVAHEDIRPTLEWQEEIERALATMDALVAVLTRDFSKSVWTQQEIGFALGRGTKIISLKMGEDPAGFISRKQALPRGDRTAEAVAAEIVALLKDDARTSRRLAEAQPAKLPTADMSDLF